MHILHLGTLICERCALRAKYVVHHSILKFSLSSLLLVFEAALLEYVQVFFEEGDTCCGSGSFWIQNFFTLQAVEDGTVLQSQCHSFTNKPFVLNYFKDRSSARILNSSQNRNDLKSRNWIRKNHSDPQHCTFCKNILSVSVN